MTFYKTTVVNINNLTSFFAKKMQLEEDGLEFNLQTGELFYVDAFNHEKELIVKLDIQNINELEYLHVCYNCNIIGNESQMELKEIIKEYINSKEQIVTEKRFVWLCKIRNNPSCKDFKYDRLPTFSKLASKSKFRLELE